MLSKIVIALSLLGLFLFVLNYPSWEGVQIPKEIDAQREGNSFDPSQTFEHHRRLLSSEANNGVKHPFLSENCVDFLSDKEIIHSLKYQFPNVFIIIPVHNIDSTLLLASVSTTF
jgi:hypothetical protein